MQWVYVLSCSDGGIYVGCAEDIKERLERHRLGNVPATKSRLPIKLIQCHGFVDKYVAFNFEKYLKSASGRAFAKKHFISPVFS